MNQSRGFRAPTVRVLRTLILVAAAWTGEAAADTYVILSLIGDHVTMVGQRRETGSRMDRNEYEVVPLAESAFDDFAVRVADATIAKARPDAGVVTLRASDPTLQRVRDSWLDADLTGVQDVIPAVKMQLPPTPDAHVLLITPYRAQPELKTEHDERGTGKVAGLGFYIDAWTRLRRSDTREGSRGFLGVFANFQLVVINLQSGKIEAHERVVIGTTYSSARAEDRTPSNALVQAQRVKAVESLMKQGIERTLPGMLSSAKQ
jgi:hypothetical protein